MPPIPLETPQEFQDLIDSEQAALILKHSTRCSISTEAHREFVRFLDAHPEIPGYIVLVVENRATSVSIAETLGVKHASPQVIAIAGSEARWDASHWDISQAALAEGWSTATAAG